MEEDIKVQVCRLCFNLITDKTFFSIEGSLRDMLQIITTDLNLDITNFPVMCHECSKMLQELFNFKTNFFESEEKIDSEMSNSKDKKLNLRDIMYNAVNNKSKRKSSRVKLENNKVCRTCLSTIKEETFIFLNKDVDPYLTSMLDSCLPELDLNLTSDPVMCSTCYKTLQKMKDFQSVCKKNESQIDAYFKETCAGLQKKISLHSVLQFLYYSRQSSTPEYVLVKGEPGRSDVEIKTEKILDQDDDLEVKNCLQNVMVKMEPDDKEYGSESVKREEISGVENCLDYVMVKMEPTDEEEVISQNVVQLHSTENCGSSKPSALDRLTEEPAKINIKITEINRPSKRSRSNKKTKRTIYCSACNFRTRYKKNSLRDHLIKVHNQKDVLLSQKLYQCDQCDFATSLHLDLIRHNMLSHFKPKALQCTSCLFSTNQNTQFLQHILTHVNAGEMDKPSFLQLNKKIQ